VFLGKDVGDVRVARDMLDVHISGVTGITDWDFADIEVTKLLGDGAAVAPVDGALVFIEHWDAFGGIRELEVGNYMLVKHLGGFAALVHRKDLGLTGATGGLRLAGATPCDWSAHSDRGVAQ
jgi:hypothetical protein